MHPSLTVFLINDDVRAIACSYEPSPSSMKPKTTLFKTFDQSIKVGDILVVPSNTRHKFTTVKAEEVDVEIDLDYEDEMDWIAHKVNLHQYNLTLADEEKARVAVQKLQRKKKREELRAAMFAENEAEMKTLALTNLNEEEKEPPF